MTAPAVEFDGVRKSFGPTKAVDGLSLVVSRGEMFGVIGPDGAGKTTTLRLLAAILDPTRGRATVAGFDTVRQSEIIKRRIGYMAQQFSLYGDLSIDENIAFFAEIHGVRDFKSRRTRLLDLTGLTRFRDRLADHLSGGMKQKLALACTLVHEPRLLVLDEPTTGVDPVSRREFWKLLAEFLVEGLTIVLATPYLDEAERCGRVALVSQGRLLALDEPARLIASMHGTILEVVATPVREALHALRERLGRDRVQLFGDRLHVRVSAAGEAARVTAELERAGFTASHVRPIVPTLEDVFIEQLAAARA